MKDRILVPLNDSEPARAALAEALEIFGDRELVVLHVPEFTDVTRGADGAATDDLLEDREAVAEDLFDEAQRLADEHGVTLERVVQPGNPGDVIVSFAEENDIDHVVMGSHGRSGLKRMMLGSVAEGVMRNSPVSVTITRPGTGSEASSAQDVSDTGDASETEDASDAP